MTWEEAARTVAARRRMPRIEWLCSEENPDPGLREQWRARVVALADGAPPEPPRPTAPAREDRPTAAESIRLLAAAKSCPFASRDSACGCQGVRCGLRPQGRQVVALQACIECQLAYPDPA